LQSIPDYAWQQHGNGIWKVKFPYSLVRNGLLSEGKKYWSIWSASNDATISNTAFTCSTGKTAPCLNINTTNSTGLISSAPFTLEKGATYNVSFSSFLTMDSNVSKWSVWSPAQDLAIKTGAACLNNQTGSCLTVASNNSVGLLSSNSFSITQGQSYTLTFSAYIPTGKTAKVIVRQSSGSFSTLGLSSSLSGTGSWKSYTYTFTATATETAARLDFEIPTASTVQFQKVKLNLPLTPTKAFVRQNGGSYQNLGLAATANNLDGVWKDSTYTFTATSTSANARLDFEVPSNSAAQFQNIEIIKVQDNIAISQLLENDLPQGVAHHPNKGFDSTLPNSMYFKTASTSPTVVVNGKNGSNYFTTGNDFFLPTGGSIKQGTEVTIRNHAYELSHVKVTDVTNNKVSISPNTNMPLYWTGMGYFFTNELWMLDSVNEWYFDASSQVLYYYPSSEPLSNNIKYSNNIIGADLRGKSYIQLDGISFNGIGTGVNAYAAKNITLNNLDISNTLNAAITAENTDTLLVQNSNFNHIGDEGVVCRNSNNTSVINNTFDQIAAVLDNQLKIISIPHRSIGVIVLGNNSRVRGNTISNYGRKGINTLANSVIENNLFTNGCLVNSDCGAIHLDSRAAGTNITGNLINGLVGDVNGLPTNIFPMHTVGVYIDEGSNNNEITGNTITSTEYGIQLHDAYQLKVTNNLVFGSRKNEILIQESFKTLNPEGNVHDLLLTGNKIFPTNPTGQLRLWSTVTNLNDFGVFDGNLYSNYYNPSVVSERYGLTKYYTLSAWQASTFNGVTRNNEPNGKVAAPLGNYTIGLLQSNIISNANFQNGTTNWSRYGTNGTGPAWTLTNCTPAQTTVACIEVDASIVAGNLSTPKFDIQKDHDYFLSFDVRASDSSQVISAIVRQAGPTYFNNLMSVPLTGTQGTTGWKRYSTIFKATADALIDGSIAGVSGARIDFTGIKAGQSIWLANLELIPVGQQSELQKTATIISNPSFVPQNYGCPTNDAFLCNNYINFATASKVNWPISLPALGSAVIYTQSLDYPDTDMDGIPNSQDLCSSTSIGVAVNSKGCGL